MGISFCVGCNSWIERLVMKKIIAICIFMFISQFTYAQSSGIPARYQRTSEGVFELVAQNRGFSASDPRVTATLPAVGAAATALSTAAGAGLLVAGAPVWGTILAEVALTAGLTYAMPIAIDAATNWMFGTPAATPITVSAPTSALSPAAQSSSGPQVSIPILSSAPLMTTVVTNSENQLYSFISGNPGNYTLNNYYSVLNTSNSRPSSLSALYVNSGSYVVSGTAWYAWLNTVSLGATICPVNYTQNGSACVATAINSTNNLTLSNQTLAQAISDLNANQLSLPVNYSTTAALLNNLWQQAASQPGYSGLPYDSTQPITASDVSAYATANPSSYPTVADLVAPVPTGTSGFYPATPSSASSTTIVPATTANVSSTSINPSTTTTTQINLGPDPVIGSPTLESTPTAAMILAPIFALFPSFQSYAVPAHSSVCPTGSFQAFNQTFTMDVHCTLFQNVAPTLQSVMLLSFILVALFIVLKA